MPTASEPYTLFEANWVLRLHHPSQPPDGQVIILLHGLTGNETVMDIFAHRLPKTAWLISPRAPEPIGPTAFSWVPATGETISAAAYSKAAQALHAQLPNWLRIAGVRPATIDLMGFSQGGAIGYALSFLYPAIYRRLVAVASFIPEGLEAAIQPGSLTRSIYFIAHGTQDQTVPIERAHAAVEILEAQEADVTLCEDDVGHKLSAHCFQGIGAFFRNRLPD